MATITHKRGVSVVRGRNSSGRVEKRFSKRRYGAEYKEYAEKLYTELLSCELSGAETEVVVLKPAKITFGDLIQAYNSQHLQIRTRSGNNKSFLRVLEVEWGTYQIVPHCHFSKKEFREWIWKALNNPIRNGIENNTTHYSAKSLSNIILYAVRVFNWAIQQELIPIKNPLENFKDDDLNKEFRRRRVHKEAYLTL